MERTIVLLIILLIATSIALISLLFYFKDAMTSRQAGPTPIINELNKVCNNSESSFVVIYHTTRPNTQLFNLLSTSISNAIASNTSNYVNVSFSLCLVNYRSLSSELKNKLTPYQVFPLFGIYSTSADLSKAKLVTAYFDNVEGFYISKSNFTMYMYAYVYNYYGIPILNDLNIYLETTKMPKLDIDEVPVIGSINAGIYIFIYEDAWCPYCAKFHIEVLPALEKHIENGTIALALKNLVVHQEARDIHRYLAAVYIEGKNSTQIRMLIDEIYHRVYTNVYPTTEDVIQLIRSISGFVPDLSKYDVDEIVLKDSREAQHEYGIYATPGFVIWSRERGVGIIVLGYRSIETFLNLIYYIS